ncbi:MAG: acetylglutamate kinase [Chitinophagaceae bacterium]
MKEKLFVVKIGGNVIDEEKSLTAFLEKFAAIPSKKILVHGGGKIATRIGNKLGIESKYEQGRRITDDETIDLVTMVYGGLVNKKIVAILQSMATDAIGLTGADANCIPADKRPVKTIDYGWVGDIRQSDLSVKKWQIFLDNGLVPVASPLTHDSKCHILNTNADTIASSLAVLLSEAYDVRLIYCFEKTGVLEDVANESSVIPVITRVGYVQLLADNKLFEGIIPKIDNAFAAIESGVSAVIIGNADDLIRNTGDETLGTVIVKE